MLKYVIIIIYIIILHVWALIFHCTGISSNRQCRCQWKTFSANIRVKTKHDKKIKKIFVHFCAVVGCGKCSCKENVIFTARLSLGVSMFPHIHVCIFHTYSNVWMYVYMHISRKCNKMATSDHVPCLSVCVVFISIVLVLIVVVFVFLYVSWLL